jgi:hypothetical protein
MFIGALRIELYIPESTTLKEKRQVLKSVIDRTRHKFNVAVAEIDHLDTIKRGCIAVACASNSEYMARKILSQVERAIVSWSNAEVIDSSIHIFTPF